MSKMFNRGTERMSAKEIILVYGENEILEISAKEYADYETLIGKDYTTFTTDDLEVYDIIQEENGIIWYMIMSTSKEGSILVKNMVNDIELYFDNDCIKDGMKLIKHYEMLRLAKPLIRKE